MLKTSTLAVAIVLVFPLHHMSKLRIGMLVAVFSILIQLMMRSIVIVMAQQQLNIWMAIKLAGN